jgi:acyl-CoA reductase-like NAD-dependent aldehyde dehydrogenase
LVEVHGNTIGGERVPSQSGGAFEVLAPGRRPASPSGALHSIGSWPRSGAADVEAALARARDAEDAWWRAGAGMRQEILARAARELAGDPDPRGLLAERLGLAASELSPHFSGLPEALARARAEPASLFADRRIAERGLLLLAPGWGELVAGPASALFAALALGRSALLVSDPVAPMIAESIADALARAGLPHGVLAVLHDDGDDALRAAASSGAATYFRGSGFPERVARLARIERLGARPGAARFGAGLGAAAGTAVELRALRSSSTIVGEREDLARRAAEVADAAFGRVRSLSGQLPGQIGRAIVHERALSRFTAELLAALRQSRDLEEPAPFVDREAEEALRRARVLGLDEGATLIFDRRSDEAAPEGAAAEDADDDPDDAILAPSVFTNVEERMQLAALDRPSSILCLLRVSGDAQAAAVAARLDHSGQPLEVDGAPRR